MAPRFFGGKSAYYLKYTTKGRQFQRQSPHKSAALFRRGVFLLQVRQHRLCYHRVACSGKRKPQCAVAGDGYFNSFITSPVSPVVFALLFMGVTAFIVYNGVEEGIERVSCYMMPLIALLSTVLIGWIKTPDYIIGEMERNGETFRRKKLYTVMMRYVAPVMMLVLFMQSTGILA